MDTEILQSLLQTIQQLPKDAQLVAIEQCKRKLEEIRRGLQEEKQKTRIEEIPIDIHWGC